MGWITRDGPGEMTMISGRLKSMGYVELLEENLSPTIEISYEGLGNIVFMQVNSHNNKIQLIDSLKSCKNLPFLGQ